MTSTTAVVKKSEFSDSKYQFKTWTGIGGVH